MKKVLSLLFLITLIPINISARNGNGDDPNFIEVNKTLTVGETVEFEGRDHRSTPCVFYSVEVEGHDFWDNTNNLFEFKETMNYDNPSHLDMPGGDGGIRHITLTALKPGQVKVTETRNDCESFTVTTYNYTIVDKKSNIQKPNNNSGKKKHKRHHKKSRK